MGFTSFFLIAIPPVRWGITLIATDYGSSSLLQVTVISCLSMSGTAPEVQIMFLRTCLDFCEFVNH